MVEKIKAIEQVIAQVGLSKEEVISYWQQKSNNEPVNPETSAVVNSDFTTDDIRSQTKLFWYAFAGGKFASDPKAYPNCQGVVGWINPDKNASEGDRIYVVLPEFRFDEYSYEYCKTGANDENDGRANTLRLIDYARQHFVKFPAALYAHNYCKNGVTQGEVFLPAREQLRQLCKHSEGLRESLRKIGGSFHGELFSSTEASYCDVWVVHSNSGGMTTYSKNCNKTNVFTVYILAY